MSLTPEKTPRSFTVLMQDGTVHEVLPTPDTQEDRDLLYFDAYWGHCLDLFEVTATDADAARVRAVAAHERAMAIEDYMNRVGVSHQTAWTVYRDSHTWARALTPDGRASWHTDILKSYAPLKHFALIEAMRDLGEPITE
ncbi:hypothetical protein Z951_02760 [Streptomyces sp. PRh5]|uniref:hypothetical protein n=1 Tax=Streptomyces sp. PRh5 TaxID=1158056 RepID=UPI0004526B70|nr:hypothetical protein [Streptomyces sp. PRh5]EXU69640.1 hypothetical protein Z951_02760 [Streptomyces sp. PRh5]